MCNISTIVFSANVINVLYSNLFNSLDLKTDINCNLTWIGSLVNTGKSSSLKQLSILGSWLILSIANSTALSVNISHSLRSLFESGEQGKNPRNWRGCLTSSEVQLYKLWWRALPLKNIIIIINKERNIFTFNYLILALVQMLKCCLHI